MDAAAAVVAARLRVRQPAPPTGRRRRGTKPEQREGWLLDVQIAACAWVNGAAVTTENLRDFDCLADLIAAIYPEASRLHVDAAPDLAGEL
jgi:predicted nucleic acid-binding protein